MKKPTPSKSVFRGTVLIKVLSIGLSVAIVFLLLAYGAGAIARSGGFSISFAGSAAPSAPTMSLSETADFAHPTTRLEVERIREMTNISEHDIPDDVASFEGLHAGTDYLAYTFYVQNTGGADCTLHEEFHIEGVVKHVDEALRVRVYRGGTAETYAKAGADGLPEPNTTAFYDDLVFALDTENFTIGRTIKYTIVIWLEGDDPQCLDTIKGGTVKMSMTFTLLTEP